MTEAVRLVVWDLDETFWSGTLTEGGIVYNKTHHEIVISLAERGIMSSICSKNDCARIEKVLKEHGIWEYFIFPSVDWSSKGPRLAALVEAVQLRAATVLFVDDNRMNLAEAAHFVPGIQTAEPDAIAGMLANPLFKGKDDKTLSRLQQYKVLEQKRADGGSATDNTEFLRASDIRVTIDHYVEENIDRAIELINRTNQLNFTKIRLSEDADLARAELRELLSGFSVQAGLISVRDRYGDYGHVGIYIQDSQDSRRRLLHFAFSCRTLNMGIETWVYRHLHRPMLKVVGEVLSDVKSDETPIDWITLEQPDAGGESSAGTKSASRMILRGGCDLVALAHYLSHAAETTHLETFIARDGGQIRTDHSVFLRYALAGISAEQQVALEGLGYTEHEFCSTLSTDTQEAQIWVFSFWMDSVMMLYEDRMTGIRAPLMLPNGWYAPVDVTSLPPEAVEPALVNDAWRARYAHLKDRFDAIGPIKEADFKATAQLLLKRANSKTRIFVLLCTGIRVDKKTGFRSPAPRDIVINGWMREVFEGAPNVRLIEPMRHILSESEMPETNHFNRIVYHRMADEILTSLKVPVEV